MRIQQAAAIPYRRKNDRLRICLVTSRRGSWTFPKGMIDGDDSSEHTALKEAEEEAGLTGEIEGSPVGHYTYAKWGRNLTVEVHLMRVDKAAKQWDEQDSRERRWFEPGEAREALPHEVLRALLDRALARLKRAAAGADSSAD